MPRHVPAHIFWTAAGCMALLITAIAWPYAFREKTPNVIFIVVDTLRADHLSLYGYQRQTTPGLERLASEATVFSHAYSQAPCTRPSMWNIMTSRYQAPVPSPPEEFTMAEFFQEQGYRTAAFVSQHFLDPSYGLAQGFELYDFTPDRDRHNLSARQAQSVTAAAVDWISDVKESGSPFFAWLVYFDPHDPYSPPEDYRGRFSSVEAYPRDRRAHGVSYKAPVQLPEDHRAFLTAAYDEEIAYLDSYLGDLADYLRRYNILDNTVIVVTADHGEELGDNGDRWDHCQLLSREELHVPLLIKPPGSQSPRRIETPAQTIDIFPTLVDLIDSQKFEALASTFEGDSLASQISAKDRPGPVKRYAVSVWKNKIAVLNGKELYIKTDGIEEISGLAAHPSEAEVREIFKRIEAKKSGREKYYDRILGDLKSLGYL